MNYIKEDIETMLISHKENEGKIVEIELKIDEYEQRLEHAGTIYEDTEKEVIENMQLTRRPYYNIYGNTNKISDKVADTAINYEKETVHINKENIDFLKKEIDRLRCEKDKIYKKILRIKNWLEKIDERESFVLTEYYINNKGKNWNKTLTEYNNYFTKELTDRQLKTIRDNAIQSILKIVNL